MRAEVPIVKLSASKWNICVDHASGVKGAARGQADLRRMGMMLLSSVIT